MQEEYAREGIDWSYVEFIDNQECLDLLEGAANAPALAVFPLIDEACRLPRATYQVRNALGAGNNVFFGPITNFSPFTCLALVRPVH